MGINTGQMCDIGEPAVGKLRVYDVTILSSPSLMGAASATRSKRTKQKQEQALSPLEAITFACMEDDDGKRYFFGPLLLRATRWRLAQNLYRAVSGMGERRLMTPSEIERLSTQEPGLWARIMVERARQLETATSAARRKRRRKNGSMARGSSGTDTTTDSAMSSPTNSPMLQGHDALESCAVGPLIWPRGNGGGGSVGESNGPSTGYDYGGPGVDGENGSARHDLKRKRDGQEAFRGAGVGRSAVCSVFLVEASSRVVDFMSANLMVPKDGSVTAMSLSVEGDQHTTATATVMSKGGSDALARGRSRSGTARSWAEWESPVAEWAARRAALWTEIVSHPTGSLSPGGRRRRRKSATPMRALLPL